jgi:hypothetical protein
MYRRIPTQLLAVGALAFAIAASGEQVPPVSQPLSAQASPTQVVTPASTAPPMTKSEMKAQRKQQKHQEKSAKANAKAQKDQSKALKQQDKAVDEQEKAAKPE